MPQSFVLSRLTSAISKNATGLILLFIIETAFFYYMMLTEFVPFFPMGFDQVSYYLDTYNLIEHAKSAGYLILLDEVISSKHANGVLFSLQGALLGLLISPTRLVIASVNLIYFIILQTILFVTVRERANATLAWISIGFLIACGTIFNSSGGIYDYRIDFVTFCLYGIWVCLLVWSSTFQSLPRALVIAFAAVLLVFMRFLTLLYVGGVLGGISLACMVGIIYWSQLSGRQIAIARLKNITIAGTVVLFCAFPVFFAARLLIYNYYVVGHFLSEEKYIRVAEVGITSVFDHLMFYPRSVGGVHIGYEALTLMLSIFGFAVFNAFRQRMRWRELFFRTAHYELLALCLAIFIPLSILTGDISKSPVVGGIVVVPIILFIVLCLAGLWPIEVRFDRAARRPGMAGLLWRSLTMYPWKIILVLFVSRLRLQKITSFVGMTAVLVGLAIFIKHGRDPKYGVSHDDLERITQVNVAVACYAMQAAIQNPVVSFDRVTSYLNWGTIILFGYERLHVLIPFSGAFGHGAYGIFATPRDTAMTLIQRSDLIVLTDPVIGRQAFYPMNTKIKEYWGEMRDWVQQNRVPILSTVIFGIPHEVFVAPPLQIGGLSQTSRGHLKSRCAK